ncbi:MAG: O-antigen ligase family protein [Pseudomonadota bacterium]
MDNTVSVSQKHDQLLYRQRHGILFLLFSIWVLSLPFHRFSIVATYSIDNLLAPFLFLAAVFLPRLRDRVVAIHRIRALLFVVVVYLMHGVSQIIPVLGVPDVFWHEAWAVLRNGFYFLVPALYIRDLWSFRVMKRLLVVITVLGAVSVFLVAIGVVHLEVERFAESRIGVDWLPKSVGLFSNYGDLSILYGFVAVLLVSHNRGELGFGLGTPIGKVALWSVLLLGLVGAQSRNMLFGTLLAIGVYWVWRRLQDIRGPQRVAFIGVFLAVIIALPGMVAVFGGALVEGVSTLGGAKAEHTATGRLESYAQAISLIARYPFGVSYQEYAVWGGLIYHVHNMWLKLLLNGGIISMFAVLALFWTAYRGGSRPARPPLLPVEPALVVASTAAVFIAVEFYPGLSDMMWVMLGTLLSFNWVRRTRAAEAPAA